MAFPAPAGSSYGEYSGLRSEGREPGARRKKLAGYLKAANELRQSYFAEVPTKDRHVGDDDSVWADAAVVRKGTEEMILFPSYARRHVKSKPAAEPGTIQETPAGGRDYRDTAGAGDAEFWKREWQKYEDDNAIVDVDVRGWLYSPHKGPTTRKQRLLIGLARQLSGIPAPPNTSGDNSRANSRPTSPTRRQDEELVNHEAEQILRKGKAEADVARRGGFSEAPSRASDAASIYSFGDDDRGRPQSGEKPLSHHNTGASQDETGTATPQMGIKQRPSWNQQPSKMTAAELAIANNHLLSRLKPFMANPLANTPISAFFYNDTASRQKTVYTDTSGHFSLRAALDFIPTHVRLLAGENLSATEEVHITEPHGVSLISDIDDTIKHSAITSGAREIFRNAFIRDLSDLTVDGVKEWYQTMHDMGVEIHYVSNSPWQMYPILTSYFAMAGLPRGSFHLKQYSGMLQGIFEPVAERKKSNLDRIMRDFPDRKYILIGDSGEADLEIYTDVALENPDKIMGVFIRDVSTPIKTGYFDPSNGSGHSGGKQGKHHSRNHSGDSLAFSKRLSRPDDIRHDDADLKAAIAASLADMEEEARFARKHLNPDRVPEDARYSGGDGRNGTLPLPPRRSSRSPLESAPVTPEHEKEDLIDFGEELPPLKPWVSQTVASPPTEPSAGDPESNADDRSQPPNRPRPPSKPKQLRSPSPLPGDLHLTKSNDSSASRESKTPPPRPRKPSSAVKPPFLEAHPELQRFSDQHSSPSSGHGQHTPQAPPKPSPLSQVQQHDSTRTPPPALPSRPSGYREKFSRRVEGDPNAKAHPPPRPPFALPSFGFGSSSGPPSPRTMSSVVSSRSHDDLRKHARSSSHHPHGTKAPPPPPPPRRTATSSTSRTFSSNNALKDRRSGNWSDNAWDGHSSHRPNSSPGSGSLPTSPGEMMSKKEALWQQRVAKARGILEPRGVTLRTWRVGSDVADVAIKLIDQAQRDMEWEKRRGAVGG